jgi:hypothetical protein
MKLCKDCKHVLLPPHPLANFAYGHVVAFPMCAHPTATVDPVYGHTIEKCEMARMGPNCGPDAKLFEQAPPYEPPKLVPLEPVEPIRTGFLERIFGRWL